jgi:hypothetical protein
MRCFLFFFLTLVSFTSFKTQTIIGDTNADGCVNLDDILSVLGTYGQCLDECGVPNGDNSTCTDCCGIVNGDGSTCDGPCPCGEEIPDDACDCEGNQLDAIGVCGGECTADENLNGICDDSETPATLECQSCGYYDLDSFGEYTVWNPLQFTQQNLMPHRVLDWDGNAFTAPPNATGESADLLFECYKVIALVDYTAATTLNLQSQVVDFSQNTNINAGSTFFGPSGSCNPTAPLYSPLQEVAPPTNSDLWGITGDNNKCINTCSASSSLPHLPVGINGSVTFSPQRWDFGFVRFQNNTNNLINPTRTEGDRRYMFRYHSGRNKIEYDVNDPNYIENPPLDDGFDNIIFEYKEWIWTTSTNYPTGPTDNWFAMSGGGWMEVSSYVGGVPQVGLVPAGDCRLCYAYNENATTNNNTTWLAGYGNMKSLYEVTHGICVGGEPTYSEGNLPNLYIDSCQLDSPP